MLWWKFNAVEAGQYCVKSALSILRANASSREYANFTSSRKAEMIHSACSIPERIFRIGRSGHTRKSSSRSYTHEPSPGSFTYPRSIAELAAPYGVDGAQRVTPDPWDSKVGRAQSFTLDLDTGCSRPLQEDPEAPFVRTIGALYTRFTVYCWHVLPRFLCLSQTAPSETIHFGRQCKDRRYTGSEILMTRCNALRLSSVPSLMYAQCNGAKICYEDIS